MGWEKNGWTAFTAAIFDLGVRGLVKIDNPGKTLTVTTTGKAAPADLGPAERIVFNHFASKGSVTVNTTTGPKLNETRGQFVSAIEGENRQAYFNNNFGYVIFGIAFSAAVLLALVLFDMIDPVTLIFAGIAAVFVGILTGVLKNLLTAPLLGRIVIVIWVVIFGGNLIGSFGSMLSGLNFDTPVIGAVLIILINVIFAVLMRAPTVQGRKVMDQLDGFRMYMDTAEKNRLNMTGEPPMTVERFERILPYAIALDVEKPWSEHFEAELARNAVSDASGSYQPGFYSGRSWSGSSGSFSNAVSSVATGMSAAMIAAQPVELVGLGLFRRWRWWRLRRWWRRWRRWRLVGARAQWTIPLPLLVLPRLERRTENARTPRRTVLGRNPRAHAAQGRRGPQEGRHQCAGRCRPRLRGRQGIRDAAPAGADRHGPAGPLARYARGAQGPARRLAAAGHRRLPQGRRPDAPSSRPRSRSDPKKGEFYVAHIDKKGAEATEILSAILPKVINGFDWPKSMQWGNGGLDLGAAAARHHRHLRHR